MEIVKGRRENRLRDGCNENEIYAVKKLTHGSNFFNKLEQVISDNIKEPLKKFCNPVMWPIHFIFFEGG
jgi:hypothetical protein